MKTATLCVMTSPECGRGVTRTASRAVPHWSAANRPVVAVTFGQTVTYTRVSGYAASPLDVSKTASQLFCKNFFWSPVRLNCAVTLFAKSWNLKLLNDPRYLSVEVKSFPVFLRISLDTPLFLQASHHC